MPAVAQRQLGLVQDLVRVQRRERDLAGADEEQLGVGVGERVDLLAVGREDAAADERMLAHEHGGDDRCEPLAAELVDRVRDGREVQAGDIAEQVAEA